MTLTLISEIKESATYDIIVIGRIIFVVVDVDFGNVGILVSPSSGTFFFVISQMVLVKDTLSFICRPCAGTLI
jgi:hypothetical protein